MKKTNKKQKKLIIKNLSNYYDLLNYEYIYDGVRKDEIIEDWISHFDDFDINGEKIYIITENNNLESEVIKEFEQVNSNHEKIIYHLREISDLIDRTYYLMNNFEEKYKDNIEE